jgi:spore maturation protein CgeB
MRSAGNAMLDACPSLNHYRDRHTAQSIVVCGCGESLRQLPDPQQHITIGVNDVGRLFDPTYLVVVNPRSQFKGDRFRYIEQANAQALFTQLDLGRVRPPVVRFCLGKYGGTDMAAGDVLHYTQNSPYVAVCLAAYMGAKRIGLIGVDLTDHHFFAHTGRHSLANRLREIDEQYGRLGAALRQRGVELYNLSAMSRLTSLPRAEPQHFLDELVAVQRPTTSSPRVFFVNYQFQSCGNVFTRGLEHAAQDLGLEFTSASCDDASLPASVERFQPDLLFVVHGRKFRQRWGSRFQNYRSAVWLLDEPYEVDDTVITSRLFDTVFVNDAATIARHRNAHYLPCAWDPRAHTPAQEHKLIYDVGFIGGANATREAYLLRLVRAGMLSYVVGGPWRSPELCARSLGSNIPPARTAELYRQTRVVVNVFRDQHHFNRARIAATSLNPRVFEALACGAAVVSEHRAECAAFPEMPVFTNRDELVDAVRQLLAEPDARSRIVAACRARLAQHTYTERLRAVLRVALPAASTYANRLTHTLVIKGGSMANEVTPVSNGATACVVNAETAEADGTCVADGWEQCGPIECRHSGEVVILRSLNPPAPGSERGLVTTRAHRDVLLSFEVMVAADTCFIAKVNQSAKVDQKTNSYHLYCQGTSAYLARHNHVFGTLDLPPGQWVPLQLSYRAGVLSACESGRTLHSVGDGVLRQGFAFLGVKHGEAHLRNIQLESSSSRRHQPVARPEAELIWSRSQASQPRVSIVTTVYDRVSCLTNCIRSVRALHFRDYEHIIVSDGPPPAVVEEIAALVRSFDDPRICHINLKTRHNNWGIAPAAEGLRRAAGEYVAFLSDDNGYTPDHVGTLVDALDRNPALGFVYSSCRYAGRLVLRTAVPMPARIDLGQPMFRRELFRTHLDDDLPFDLLAWDWALIDTLMKRRVRWKHIDVPSFVFRLSEYPELVPQQ